MSTRRLTKVVLHLEKRDGQWVGDASVIVDSRPRQIAEVWGADDDDAISALERLVDEVRLGVEGWRQ